MISVIMPVYNSVQTLAHAIDSVRAQSLTDWELLIADDGSTDNSVSMAQRYAAQDDRIRVLTLAHVGVSHARNRALERAQGDYIAFLDSDDVWELHHLQILLRTIGDTDCAVGGYHVESDLTRELLQIEQENSYINFQFTHIAPMPGTYTGNAQMGQGIVNLLETDTLYPIWNKLYRRALIEQHQIRFDQTLRCWGEDELFNCDYLRVCNSMVCTEERTVRYMTQDENALSYQYDDLRLLTEQRLHDVLVALLADKGDVAPKVRRLLGEIYIGKLVLLLEHDLRQSFVMDANELRERWETLLCEEQVQVALDAAGLRAQFVSYLQMNLLLPLFVASMLSPHAAVFCHIKPHAYLQDWLLAADCAYEQRAYFEKLHQRAMAAGAPWPLDGRMGGSL